MSDRSRTLAVSYREAQVVEPTKLVNFIYAAHPNSPVIVGPSEIEMEEHGTSRCGLVGIILSAHCKFKIDLIDVRI